MDFQTFLFWVFATITIGSALAVVTVRNPVHAALYLVLAFINTAGIWLLLQAEFLAITLVLVYVGAVMVLFLFVVMMLDINLDEMRARFRQHFILAAMVGVVILLELFLVIWARFGMVTMSAVPQPPVPVNNTFALGQKLYTQYVYPFELAAVLLTVAIVAAIALTLRRRKDTRYNDPDAAVRVKAKDRLRMVQVKPVSDRAKANESDSSTAKPTAPGASS